MKIIKNNKRQKSKEQLLADLLQKCRQTFGLPCLPKNKPTRRFSILKKQKTYTIDP